MIEAVVSHLCTRSTLIAAIVFAWAGTGSFPARAQTYSDSQFTAAKGGNSFAGLTTDNKGHFYGTASVGGTANQGTVFETAASSQTILYSFSGKADGGTPVNGLVRDSAGNLYGMTEVGGDFKCSPPGFSNLGCGTVFKLTPSGQFSVLHTFSGAPSDAADPNAGGALILDGAGNLYGTTGFGGLFNLGALFEISVTGQEKLLYSFGATSGDGFAPQPGLLLTNSGLVGATQDGGSFGFGTIFRIDGHGNETILHSFNRTDGTNPNAPLTRDSAGNLYGTTGGGGANSCGTVFELDTSNTLSILHSFNCSTDGLQPAAPVTRDKTGNLYGTTWQGGTGCSLNNCGVLYELVQTGGTWTETVLHNFDSSGGANPEGTLLLDSSGNIYGTTLTGGGSTCFYGGNNIPGCGTAFKAHP